MSGIDNIAGIDFQISYGVYRLLDLVKRRTPFEAIRFEEPNDEGQDLSIYYQDKTAEIIQVKKRGEAYLWTPSSVRPVIERFIQNRVSGGRYVFFSDGSLNHDMVELREAIANKRLDSTSDEKLKSLCQIGISPHEIRDFIKDLSFQTRQFVSNDSSKPGEALRLECLRFLSSAPFTPLLNADQVYDRLWNVVFDASKQARSLSIQNISDLLDLPGLMQRPQGPPVVPIDAVSRQAVSSSIEEALQSALFVYGISGTGKSTAVSQFVAANADAYTVFWFTTSHAVTVTTIRQLLAASLEEIGVTTCSDVLRNKNTSDIEAIKSALLAERILCVFDAAEKSSEQIAETFREISILVSETKSRAIYIGQELPGWFNESVVRGSKLADVHIRGLEYEEFISYIGDDFDLVSAEQLEWFFRETGGLPIAASLLKASLSRAKNSGDIKDIFQQDAKSIQKYLFSNVISKLNDYEREFIEVSSVFEYVFTVEEANLILERPLKSLHIIKSLTSAGIITELKNGLQIHDSVRPLAYGMLLPEVSTEYHKKMAIHYKQQMEVSGHLFELIDKWGSHLDKVDELKSRYMRQVSSLENEQLFCLWSIYYSGFPYCFSEKNLKEQFAYTTELVQANLVKFEVNFREDGRVFELDRPPTLLTLTTEDGWDTSFIWYLAQRETPANHMGYINVTEPNFAWQLQRHTICPWEHCIEYEPLMPYDQNASSVQAWFEHALADGEFAWRDQVSNLNILSRLDELIRLEGTQPGDKLLYEIVGSCPIFGHCCPGGPEQSDICRKREERYEADQEPETTGNA